MNVVALPRDQYGIFYEGDAYIVYAASPYRQPIGVDTVVSSFKHSISFVIWGKTNDFSPKRPEGFPWSSTFISG